MNIIITFSKKHKKERKRRHKRVSYKFETRVSIFQKQFGRDYACALRLTAASCTALYCRHEVIKFISFNVCTKRAINSKDGEVTTDTTLFQYGKITSPVTKILNNCMTRLSKIW